MEDLQGFWEMIYIQVEDVDKKLTGLAAVEENSWKPIEVRQPLRAKTSKSAVVRSLGKMPRRAFFWQNFTIKQVKVALISRKYRVLYIKIKLIA